MALAEAAGVEVSLFRLQLVLKRPVLMARRFDRRAGRRIPYISALTALDASDHEMRSYLEIAEFLRREGSKVNEDLRQLWRRIVFNMLVSNTDDHLRNHGFLREPDGWRLAPAYDLNPMPADVKPRIHALAIDESDGTASLDTAFRIVPMFGMTEGNARTIAAEVGTAVGRWRNAAARHGITQDEAERMSSRLRARGSGRCDQTESNPDGGWWKMIHHPRDARRGIRVGPRPDVAMLGAPWRDLRRATSKGVEFARKLCVDLVAAGILGIEFAGCRSVPGTRPAADSERHMPVPGYNGILTGSVRWRNGVKDSIDACARFSIAHASNCEMRSRRKFSVGSAKRHRRFSKRW